MKVQNRRAYYRIIPVDGGYLTVKVTNNAPAKKHWGRKKSIWQLIIPITVIIICGYLLSRGVVFG